MTVKLGPSFCVMSVEEQTKWVEDNLDKFSSERLAHYKEEIFQHRLMKIMFDKNDHRL